MYRTLLISWVLKRKRTVKMMNLFYYLWLNKEGNRPLPLVGYLLDPYQSWYKRWYTSLNQSLSFTLTEYTSSSLFSILMTTKIPRASGRCIEGKDNGLTTLKRLRYFIFKRKNRFDNKTHPKISHVHRFYIDVNRIHFSPLTPL